MINGIASLVAADTQVGNSQDKHDVAALLWSIAESMPTVEAIHDIGDQAEYPLRKSMKRGG